MGDDTAERADIAEAFARVKNKFGIKSEVKHLLDYLEPDEPVREMTSGLIKGKGNGALVLTDRRVAFIFHGAVRKGLEEFRLEHVTSVSSTGGVMFSTITLTVAGAAAKIENVDKKDAARMVPAIREALAAPRSTPGPTGEGNEVFAQIAKLKELHGAGALTDEEFAAKKTELLGRV